MSKNKALFIAVARGDVETIRTLAHQNVNLEEVTCHMYHYTPLLHAIDCRNVASIIELLKLGANPNTASQSRDHLTPLYLAVRKIGGNFFTTASKKLIYLEIIKILLEYGANPNQAIKGGSTPIFAACFHGDFSVIQLLFDRGADINLIDSKQNTPLDVALSRFDESHEIPQYLIGKGATQCTERNQGIISGNHAKINDNHLFANGTFHPERTRQQLIQLPIEPNTMLKKYNPDIYSFFRSVLVGENGKYTLYDSRNDWTTCAGCLGGESHQQPLGKGGQAKVRMGQNIETKEFVAVRVVKSEDNPHEVEILKKLDRHRDSLHCNNKHYIVQQLISGHSVGNLFNISYSELIDYMKQLLSQVKILHDSGYIHRDISYNNVMVDSVKKKIYLIDFGFSVKIPFFMSGCYTTNMITNHGRKLLPELSPSSWRILPYYYSPQSDIFDLAPIMKHILNSCRVDFDNRELLQPIRDLIRVMKSQLPRERKTIDFYLDILNTLPNDCMHHEASKDTQCYRS